MYLIAKDPEGRRFLIEAQLQKPPIPMEIKDIQRRGDTSFIESVVEVSYCDKGKRITWTDNPDPMGIKWRITDQ